jgi:osmotically-inducible protein OsmY
MDERNPRSRPDRSRSERYGSRQEEQFEQRGWYDDSGYGGDRGRFSADQMGDQSPTTDVWYEEYTFSTPDRGRYQRGPSRSQRQDEAARAYAARGTSYSGTNGGRSVRSFTADDSNGGDFVGGGRPRYDGYRGAGGSYGAAPMSGGMSSGGRDERGFFERAGDEVASWFGDEDAARRRQMDHRGKGPSDYTRSDDRIREDACDRLTDDWMLDASKVKVQVANGEVTLDGTVDSRDAKRRAEDCVDCISGVKHVQNNLRVQEPQPADREANREPIG